MATGMTTHQYEGRPTSFVRVDVVEQSEAAEEIHLEEHEMTVRLGGQPRELLVVAPRKSQRLAMVL